MKHTRIMFVLGAVLFVQILLCAAGFAADFNVANFGISAFRFNATSNNPTLTLVRGTTYTFAVTASGHPFDIKTNIGNGSGNRYNVGVTGQGVQNGTLTFIVPASGPTPLFYDCEVHNAMSGTINLISPPNTPPSVSVTNPLNGAVFAAPASVTLGASASDTGGSVTNVQFRVGTTVLANDVSAPYSAVTNNMPSGSYTLTAIASDNLGATATNSVNITVDAPPTVSITNPVAGAVLIAPTNVTIQATATDNGSVSSVLFLVDANTLTTDNSSPYSALTNNLSPGNHTLTAIATDNLGLKTTNAISIIVNALPSISITNPVTGAKFLAPGNVVLEASATDADGTITNVEFFSSAVSLGNVTNSPFNFTNNNLAAGNYTFTATALDNHGGAATSSPVNISLLTNSTLLSPVLLPDGLVVFTLSGIVDQSYVIEGSTNLFDWTPILTNLAPAGQFSITNFSTNFPQQFFRSRQDY